MRLLDKEITPATVLKQIDIATEQNIGRLLDGLELYMRRNNLLIDTALSGLIFVPGPIWRNETRENL